MPRKTSAREQRNPVLVLRRIAEAIGATVNETPEGAPAGPMYAALMPHMSLLDFEQMMRLLVEVRWITRRGDLYFPVNPHAGT